MRLAWVLVAALMMGACDPGAQQLREKDREIAALKAKVAELEQRLARPSPVAAPPAGAPPHHFDLTVQFVQMVRADPVRMSRASGLKLNDIIDEDGLVVDAEKVAKAIRDKTIRMYGKTTAQRALVDYFGAEIGNAIFFEKIKNPPQ